MVSGSSVELPYTGTHNCCTERFQVHNIHVTILLIVFYILDAKLDIRILQKYSVSDFARLKLPTKTYQSHVQLKRAINMYSFEYLHNQKLNFGNVVAVDDKSNATDPKCSDNTSYDESLISELPQQSIRTGSICSTTTENTSCSDQLNQEIKYKEKISPQTYHVKSGYQRITTQLLSESVSFMT